MDGTVSLFMFVARSHELGRHRSGTRRSRWPGPAAPTSTTSLFRERLRRRRRRLRLGQIAKLRGARVITTVSTPDKADVVKRVGADDVILYTEKRIDEEVRRITGGKVRGAQRLGWMLLG